MFIHRPLLRRIWFAGIVLTLCCLSFVFGYMFLAGAMNSNNPFWILIGTALVLLSFGFDMVFVASTRLALRWCENLDRLYKITGVLAVNILLAVFLIALPLFVTTIAVRHQRNLTGTYRDVIGISGFLLMMTNFVDLIVSLLFVLLAITMLTHRVLWPALERPLYGLQNIGAIGRRKLLLTVGTLLIGLGLGAVPRALEKVLDAFG